MLGPISLVLLTLAAGALGSPVKTNFVPQKWRQAGKAAGGHVLHLNIGLKQSNFNELERHLYDGSDPDHDRYDQHLSMEDVNDIVTPTAKTSGLVHEWLSQNEIMGLTCSTSQNWISVALPIEVAERLLTTEYHIYEHEDGDRLMRTPEWPLPSKIEFLLSPPQTSPGYTLPSNASISKACNVSSVTPKHFMNLYSTLVYDPKVPGLTQVGFNKSLGEIPIRPDTAKFFAEYRPPAVDAAYNFKQISIANGLAAEGTSREVNPDAQAITGISDPTPVISYSTGGSSPFTSDINTPDNTNEPYLVWLNYALSQANVPQLISRSYGYDVQTVPQEYAQRVCKQMAPGARGVSILFASGDRGFESEFVVFRPGYLGADGNYQEIYSSGGRSSNYFKRLLYQEKVVSAHVQNLDGLYDGWYNRDGRTYPDISAQG
ncbi:uncharacterized protein K444DRAFT_661139 [Hyaloscypha bicolor E]|uniref:Peptidase S53 domain-containing protein n=1 Tax=Hyaloscypha bicolor E TaxID=1095630 RepID=A0A2J6TL54_9HELO|nr:uncharacterized protein K444DRAFT_661139 [Hyaloscypha bicolor E]PMD63736.1 hypothetical protein K444DRAFT_661139 [Hyaloscypha bicolor E]